MPSDLGFNKPSNDSDALESLGITVYTIDLSVGSGDVWQQFGHSCNTAADLLVILLQGRGYDASLLLLVLIGMYSVGLLSKSFLYILNLQVELIYLLSSIIILYKTSGGVKWLIKIQNLSP